MSLQENLSFVTNRGGSAEQGRATTKAVAEASRIDRFIATSARGPVHQAGARQGPACIVPRRQPKRECGMDSTMGMAAASHSCQRATRRVHVLEHLAARCSHAP